MSHLNHTGTLYSFFHVRQGGFFHTTDYRILKEVSPSGIFNRGRIVMIGGVEYRISNIAIELLVGNPQSISLPPNFIGEANSFTAQAEIWVEDIY